MADLIYYTAWHCQILFANYKCFGLDSQNNLADRGFMPILLLIAAILFSVFAAIKPFFIKKFPVDIVSAPLFSLAMLYAFGIIDFSIILKGLQGYGTLRPWEIILIFFTVAYVSISVDLSGILDYFAFRIVRRARGRKITLFVFFYVFASLLTIFTSNDIVILTLTPIIFYLNKHADIDIMPLLFAEFFGANTLSMLLYIGNPTNIIIGNALNLGFADYFRVMALPTLAAALGNGFLLFLVFRKRLLGTFVLRENTAVKLRSIYDALLSTSLLLLMLVVLIFSRQLGLEIWWVTLVFAGVYILEDLGIGFFHIAKNPTLYITELSADMKKIYTLYGFPSNRYDFFVIMKRIPWKILPFITVIFIFVHGLYYYGAISEIAYFLAALSQNSFSSVFVNGLGAFFLTNLINNQPAAILYANILVNPAFVVGAKASTGAAYAVIAASNLGANLTLIGALAGIMWEKILRTKGLVISYRDFLRKGFLITPFVFLVMLLFLYWVIS